MSDIRGNIRGDIRPPSGLPHIWPKSVKIRPLQNHSKCTPHSTRGSDFEFFVWDLADFGTQQILEFEAPKGPKMTQNDPKIAQKRGKGPQSFTLGEV